MLSQSKMDVLFFLLVSLRGNVVMKAIGMLCLLFSTVSFASTAVPVKAPTKTSTYTCHSYTDNQVDANAENFEDGLLSDNPMQSSITTIERSDQGYTIKKNGLFDKDVVMTNPEMQALGNFASNQTTMLFKKRSVNNLPYFIVLTTGKPASPKEKPADNPITRMITIAQCEH